MDSINKMAAVASAPLPPPLFISDQLVSNVLTPKLAYNSVIEALKCHARRDVCQPLKPYIRPQGREGEFEGGRYIAMPAYVGGTVRRPGIKWISSVPKNVHRGLPRASGIVVLNDPTTGRPQAIMECGVLSARRTGAVAAIGVNFLGPSGSKRAALLGAGPVATEVVRALVGQCPNMEEFRIHDPCYDRAYKLASWALREFQMRVAVCPTAEICVQGANIIIPATTGGKDYIKLQWLTARPWLIVALSLDDCCDEVPLAADKLVVDDFEQSVREEKLLHRLVRDGRCSRATVYAELGEIVNGDKSRPTDTDCVYLNPMGMAVEDIAVAACVYETVQNLPSKPGS